MRDVAPKFALFLSTDYLSIKFLNKLLLLFYRGAQLQSHLTQTARESKFKMSIDAIQTIRGYELQEIIGQGGFGAVYRAHQPIVDRDVAIKVILPKYSNDPDFIRNFETEARLVARLEHPFIVPLFDYWRDPEGAFLVMRYFGKGSLQGLLRQKRVLSLAETTKIVEQLGSALDIAHHYNVIHRDIKPANILLDDAGNAYLTDFGIARQLDDDTQGQEEVSGTIAYLSPEVLEGGSTSPQSDIYALGLVTYEMLAGKHPFRAESVLQMMRAHIQEELPPVAEVPPAVNTVLLKAAAKKPNERYASAGEMATALKEAVTAETAPERALAQAVVVTPRQLINPYKGLRPFEEADARDFFGREKLVNLLIERLRENNPWRKFLAVVGPSGSGKSSVVHAGLLPALRRGQPTGAQNWYIVNMVPSSNPLQQLKTSLLSVAINPADTLTGKLQSDSQGLIQAVNNVLGDNDNLLLVIDQFEEVFTLVEREEERQQFLDLLYHAVTGENQRLWIIITLRADFYDKPLLYENFGALIQARTQVVLPLTTEELERTITGPAKQVGLEVDTDLVAAIIADVREEPGVLPLLQYALTEVFAKRTGNHLNLEAYQASGGVLGALARRAEEVYQELPADQQAIAEQIFLRLVNLGEGTEDTRRRVRYSELSTLVNSTETLQTVLDAFGKYRLLTFDRDYSTREPTIEVAHEALIREWRRLQEWLDNNRNDIRLQRMLDLAATDWQSAKMDNSYLLSGTRLAQFAEWAETSSIALSQRESVFLQASLAEQRRQAKLDAQRQAEQLVLEQRARQRLQWIVGILVIASVIGLGLTVAVFQQSQTADRERDKAEEARDLAISAQATSDATAKEAKSLALSTQAQQVFNRGNTTLALQLALEATDIENSPPEVYETLFEVAYSAGMRYLKNAHDGPVTTVVISADGTLVLTGAGLDIFLADEEHRENQPPNGSPSNGNPPSTSVPDTTANLNLPPQLLNIEEDTTFPVQNNDLVLWNLATGEEIQRLVGHNAPLSDALFVENGATQQAISVDLSGQVLIWDLGTGEIQQEFTVLGGQHIRLSIDNQAHYLLVTTNANPFQAGAMVLWDMTTHTEVQSYAPTENGFWEAHLTPDATRIIVSYWAGLQTVLDVATGAEHGRLAIEANDLPPISYHTTLSPDGNLVATSGPNNQIYLWDSTTATEISAFLPPYAGIASLHFVDDGETLYVASTEGLLGAWDIETGALRGELYEQSNSHLVGFDVTNDVGVGVLGLSDGKVQVWNLAPLPPGQVSQFEGQDLINRASFIPATTDQPLRVVSLGGNWTDFTMKPEVLVWDALTGEVVARFGTGFHTYMGHSLAISPDYQWVLSGTASSLPGMPPATESNLMILWNVATGEKVREFPFEQGRDVSAIAFDPTSGTANEPWRAATNWGHNVRLWNLETGETIREFEGQTRLVQDVVFSSDGAQIIATGDDQILRVWAVATGEIVQTIELPSNSHFIALSPDDQTLVTNSSDNSLFVWDLATGELLNELIGHDERIEAVKFSHDGQYLLSGSDDTLLILWDVATGKIIRRLEGNYGRIWDVDFSPDDHYMLSVSETDGVIVWTTTPPTLDEIVEWVKDNRYLREFSQLECDAYRLNCGD